MLENNSNEENHLTKISDSSNNQSKNSNGLTITTKTQRDIHHLAINKNNKEIKEYIDSLCIDMFTQWEPKLLMDVFILSDHQQKYDIIKHVNKDCVHTIYFNPKVYNKFKGDSYTLLCKDVAPSAINHGYQIVKNGFYDVGALAANRFPCNRCIQYKGDIKCRQ